MTAQKMTEEYPNTASVLGIVGGCFIIVAGMLITTVSAFVIPHLNPSVFNNTAWFQHGNASIAVQNVPGFVQSILAGVGILELVTGLIVLGSGIMLRIHPEQSVLFGVLMLIFAVLSFFGSGGFVIGAIMGIIGGVMTLSWKRPAAQAP
jgi:hypothetical protein